MSYDASQHEPFEGIVIEPEDEQPAYEAFVIQCLRHATGERGCCLTNGFLLCDRDSKWSKGVEEWLATAGVRVVRTLPCAPNCNA